MTWSDTPAVTVAVLTFRRESLLPALLTSLIQQLDDPGLSPASRIMVVDNDPDCSARAVVAAAGDRVDYVHEATPGIAAARQRALQATPVDHLLAFIDDDEIPNPDWLSLLVDTWRTFDQPAGVAGRVVPRYEVAPDPWIAAGAFFVRRSLATGTAVQAAGAGNLLLDLRQVHDLGLSFDVTLGMRGGEDTLFTRQLTSRGGRLLWCEEAQASDLVPAARATRRWVLARGYSHGSAHSMVAVRLSGSGGRRALTRVWLVAEGLARIPVGLLRHVRGRARGDLHAQARGLWLSWRGAGMVTGALGAGWAEYRRPSRPAEGDVGESPEQA